jgi:flavin-dependent thymidylate synthase
VKLIIMQVNLVSYTPDALNLLLRTKNTRLTNQDDDPRDWTDEKRLEHLDYMLHTIKSSWEFVDYTFQIDGVTRAFTHQFVRTRTGKYAQQSLRVTDARDLPVDEPESIASSGFWSLAWDEAVQAAKRAYETMVDTGAPVQDARGVLPVNVTSSIMAKFDLRTLHEMAKSRLCTRTQGEYQDVFRAMREEVISVHPWAAKFLEVQCVATGTCAFPRYGKESCPVYLPEMDNTPVREAARRRFWEIRHVAAPIARNGKAM